MLNRVCLAYHRCIILLYFFVHLFLVHAAYQTTFRLNMVNHGLILCPLLCDAILQKDLWSDWFALSCGGYGLAVYIVPHMQGLGVPSEPTGGDLTTHSLKEVHFSSDMYL